jgi:ABC-2 type transport system ATP-binding protein
MASVEELCDTIALINKSRKILEGSMESIKSGFRTNTFRIEYEGTRIEPTKITDSYYIITDHLVTGNHFTVIVRINSEKSPNDLLQLLLPEIKILSFHEILPTMNDIFIRKVKEKE